MLRTSCITQSAKNSSLLVDVTENAEIYVIGGGDCKDETDKRSPRSNNSNRATGNLISKTRLAFFQLKKVFIEASIFWHFDPKYHIWIETNASGYAMGGVLSQLILDNLDQWNLVAYYSQKMIPAKTIYETHDGKLLAIVEAFIT